MPEKTLREALVDVADAIRAKTESQETMTIEEMPGEIASIETGIIPTGTKIINANGNGIDVYNYASVDVGVPQPSGTLLITENGRHNVTDYVEANIQVSVAPGISEHWPEMFWKLELDKQEWGMYFHWINGNYHLVMENDEPHIYDQDEAESFMEFYDIDKNKFIIYLPTTYTGDMATFVYPSGGKLISCAMSEEEARSYSALNDLLDTEVEFKYSYPLNVTNIDIYGPGDWEAPYTIAQLTVFGGDS